jgi:AmmeMemoRadiSam system protein B
MISPADSQLTNRDPVAAGRFYPEGKESLHKNLEKLFLSCKKTRESFKVRALISPHAGLVFSGKIAASAFSSVDRDFKFRNIFIIGSSHLMSFEGASVYNLGNFNTPLGKIVVNREIGNRLHNENKFFNFPADAHIHEHSLELQIPFIQYYFTHIPEIVPIIIGTTDELIIKNIAINLLPWFTEENLFVISSDFSHYPPYHIANEVDRITASGLLSGDPVTFLESLDKNSGMNYTGLVTSMCGWTSGLVLLYLINFNRQLEMKHIDYSNSGDSSFADKTRVVGYHSFALIENNNKA